MPLTPLNDTQSLRDGKMTTKHVSTDASRNIRHALHQLYDPITRLLIVEQGMSEHYPPA